jgi:predicted nucleic acid-binding protein
MTETKRELAFVDTNIFVYAFASDVAEKKTKASTLVLELFASGGLCLSLQVLQEFYTTATRKVKLSPPDAFTVVQRFATARVFRPDLETVLSAIRLSIEHQLSYWDSALIVAARNLGAETLYTEDLQHGQKLLGVRIVNPFV